MKLLRVLHALGRVGRVVEDDDVELLAGDLFGQSSNAVLDRDAEAGGRAGERAADADGDVGLRGGGGGAEQRARRGT